MSAIPCGGTQATHSTQHTTFQSIAMDAARGCTCIPSASFLAASFVSAPVTPRLDASGTIRRVAIRSHMFQFCVIECSCVMGLQVNGRFSTPVSVMMDVLNESRNCWIVICPP